MIGVDVKCATAWRGCREHGDRPPRVDMCGGDEYIGDVARPIRAEMAENARFFSTTLATRVSAAHVGMEDLRGVWTHRAHYCSRVLVHLSCSTVMSKMRFCTGTADVTVADDEYKCNGSASQLPGSTRIHVYSHS